MSDIASIVTGYDANLPISLTKDGAAFVIDSAATVQVALVSTDRTATLVPAVTCSDATAGADWSVSLIVALFSTVMTTAITVTGDALLEISVTENGEKLPWFADAIIVKGSIE